MKNLITVDTANFEEAVINSPLPVLVDFWAEWCWPCKTLAPTLELLAAELEESLIIAKINVDYNRELSLEHGVTSIPSLVLFKQGEVVGRVVGNRSLEDLKKFVTDALTPTDN